MTQQNSIEIFAITFTAGESKLFNLGGEYFEIIDAPSPVDVVLSDVNGSQRARLIGAEASFYSKNVSYGQIQITSATAQTIEIAYGSGETGTRRSVGSVSISGPVALDAATLAALESTELNAATIQQLRNPRPEVSTGTYSSINALALNTAEVVFSAAANVNGAIILAAESSDAAAVIFHQCFIAKPTAPISVVDGEVIMAGTLQQSALSNPTTVAGRLSIPQFIAPGRGLYFIQSIATNQCFRHCRYRLL